MQDANCFRFRLPPVNEAADRRVTVDKRRSGNEARDGYAVLDQANPPTSEPVPYGYGSARGRRGLSERVYDGARYEPYE